MRVKYVGSHAAVETEWGAVERGGSLEVPDDARLGGDFVVESGDAKASKSKKEGD